MSSTFKCLNKSYVEYLPNFQLTTILYDQSVKVFNHNENPDKSESLNLHQTKIILQSIYHKQKCLLDSVTYVGNMIWDMEWCPIKINSYVSDNQNISHKKEILAISTHSKQFQKNKVGQILNGPGMIQIYCINQILIENENPSIYLGYGIVHDGGVCWCLRWCPNPSAIISAMKINDDKPKYNIVGILAAILGNGEIHIILVPDPDEINLDKSNETYIKIRPELIIHNSDLCGSMPSCLDWLAIWPHNLILIGCWDGSVSIWSLPIKLGSTFQHLIHHRCEFLALRSVKWLKPYNNQNHNNNDSIYKYLICIGGHTGRISIYDIRDLHTPLFYRIMGRCYITSIAISSHPPCIYAAVEDGAIRQLSLDPRQLIMSTNTVFTYISGENGNPIWSLAISDNLGILAYGGDTGIVEVLAIENYEDSRYRKPHVGVASFKYIDDKDALRLSTAKNTGKLGGHYFNKDYLDNDELRTFSNESQVIRSLSFSPNGHTTTWLGIGTSLGLLRLVRISI